jgi:transcriptional regulator with XRE-family HTH domain
MLSHLKINLIYLLKKQIMKIYEKVKFYRETKRLSQENIAFELGLNQSQYSRRESGVIKFTAEEIEKLSKSLDVSPNELFSDETVVFNNSNQTGGNFGQYISTPIDLVNQYELRIKEKDEVISLLKDKIESFEKANKKN